MLYIGGWSSGLRFECNIVIFSLLHQLLSMGLCLAMFSILFQLTWNIICIVSYPVNNEILYYGLLGQ